MHDRWEAIDGGISRFIREVAPRLAQGDQITVIVTRSDRGVTSQMLTPSLELVHLPGFQIPGTVIYIPGFSGKIKKYLKASDVVFIQTLENTYPLILSLWYKKPLVLYFHGLDWEIFSRSMGLGRFNFLLAWLVKKFWAFWYKKADHICLPSPTYKRYLDESKIRVDHTWVPLGVDTELFAPPAIKKEAKEKIGIDPACFVLGFVGRFWPDKNLEFLFKVFSKLHAENPHFRLLLVGHGYHKYETMIKELPGAIWVGYHENVVPFMQAMDVYFQPLLHTETSSLSTMEAMSVGLPVVVNAVGCPREYIQNGENGFVVDPPNREDLFAKYILELAQNSEMRQTIGLKARNTMTTRYRWDQTAEKLKNIFRSLHEKSFNGN